MIRLYTVAPSRLNLNGDQANLLVLRARAEWFNAAVEVVALNTSGDFVSAQKDVLENPAGAFLLVGHGSAAAMKSLTGLTSVINELVSAFSSVNAPVLVVGSGYELLKPGAVRTQRRSDFFVAEAENLRVLGYRNTDADLPELLLEGRTIFTLLHGPVLAKNPALADQILGQLGVSVKANDRTEEIDAIVAKVWELEANH